LDISRPPKVPHSIAKAIGLTRNKGFAAQTPTQANAAIDLAHLHFAGELDLLSPQFPPGAHRFEEMILRVEQRTVATGAHKHLRPLLSALAAPLPCGSAASQAPAMGRVLAGRPALGTTQTR
jgi:hypothetical protein